MDKQRIITFLKVILICASICLIFMMYVADTSDCKACSYELEEKEVGIKGFMEYYYEECLDKHKTSDIENFNLNG